MAVRCRAERFLLLLHPTHRYRASENCWSGVVCDGGVSRMDALVDGHLKGCSQAACWGRRKRGRDVSVNKNVLCFEVLPFFIQAAFRYP